MPERRRNSWSLFASESSSSGRVRQKRHATVRRRARRRPHARSATPGMSGAGRVDSRDGSPPTELAHDPVPLDAGRRDCDLAPDESMPARAHRPQRSMRRRWLRHEPHGTADGGTGRLVLGPDHVRPLARDGHPAARITHDVDHPSTFPRQMSESRTVGSGYPPPRARQVPQVTERPHSSETRVASKAVASQLLLARFPPRRPGRVAGLGARTPPPCRGLVYPLR